MSRIAGAAAAVLLCLGCAQAPSRGPAPAPAPPAVDTLQLAAPGVSEAPLRVRAYLPPGYDPRPATGYPVLYVNDGQDMEAVGLQATLAALHAAGAIRPVIVVAIDMPPDRMAGYGLSDREAGRSIVAGTKYGPVGARAHAYSEWVAHVLVPLVDARYATRARPEARAVLGWSLGAVSAFNLAWQYPEVFGRVGAFSPSFWLSAESGDAASVQRSRLAHAMVDAGKPRAGMQAFIAVGTREETDDRDGDGTIDAVDDALDLVEGWQAGNRAGKGLRQSGLTVNPHHAIRANRADVAFFLLHEGRHDQPSWKRMLPEFLRWAYAVHAPPLRATGTVESWQDLPSAHVAARDVDVWLPPGYDPAGRDRYPVLYMHDGQNLFDPRLSYTGVDWGVDETMTRLVADGEVRPAIVVAVWNTPKRLQEYMPAKPVTEAPQAGDATIAPGVAGFARIGREAIASDAYLRFLVEELKPFIDRTYRTRPGRADTAIMGSSMGGLVSLYAMAEYPRVFGGVGAVSTHWPIGDGIAIDWFAAHLPPPGGHRIYFDHGDATLDARYAPYQQRMDAAMRALGYTEGRDWATHVYPGAAHTEQAWRDRVDVPLRFLLGPSAR